jgi:hypothetical protein
MTDDPTRRALAAGWQLVDGETAPGPCIGSGQLVAFLADGWTPCPVCGRLGRVIGSELAEHEPPPPDAPAPRRANLTPGLFD